MCQRRRDLQAGSLVSRWTTVSAGGHLRGGCVEKSPVPRHYSKIAAGMFVNMLHPAHIGVSEFYSATNFCEFFCRKTCCRR